MINLIKEIRTYLFSPQHRKLFSIATVIAIALAIPATAFLSQQQQTYLQRAASEEELSPTTAVSHDPLNKDAQEIGQLTNQLLQFGKSSSVEPRSISAQATNDAIETAKKRKDLLLKLAEKSPGLFLAVALKKDAQSSMPVDIQNYLEKEATAEGKIEVFIEDDFQNPSNSKTSYFLKTGSEKTNLFPTQELSITSGAKVRVQGIQLDNNIVTSTDKASFQILEAAPNPEALGDQKTLVLLIRFLNSGNPPFTKERAYDLIFNDQFQNFYREQSYNQVSFSGIVLDWLTLNFNKNDLTNNCIFFDKLKDDDLSRIVVENNIDLGAYSRIVYIIDFARFGGCSSLGKIEITVNNKVYRLSRTLVYADEDPNSLSIHPFQWTSFDTALSHEVGHGLGLLHANGWDCMGQVLHGDCAHVEYGNLFDIMGYNHFFSLHFNAYYKEQLGWIKPSSALLIDRSGTYTINPLESANPNDIKLAKIKIQGSDVIPFYLEYRRAIGFDANLNRDSFSSNQLGLFVNHIIVIGRAPDSYSFTHLLDMTPARDVGWGEGIEQATLNGENVFADADTGITIGPIRNADESSITFDIKLTNPICTPQQPLIINYYSPERITAGESGNMFIRFTNKDSFSCGESKFRGTPILPSGWTELYSDEILLSPQQSGKVDSDFSVPKNAPAGNTPLSLEITNINSGLKAHTDFVIKVMALCGPYGYGDINQDGSVNSADALLVAKHIVGTTTLTEYRRIFADVNGDNTVNSADLLLIKKYIVGTITTFPACRITQ